MNKIIKFKTRNVLFVLMLMAVSTSIVAKNEMHSDNTFRVFKMVNIVDINIKSSMVTFKDIESGKKSQLPYITEGESKNCNNGKEHTDNDEGPSLGFYCLSIMPLVESQDFKLVGKKYQIQIKYINESNSKKASTGLIIGLAQDSIPM